MPHPPPRVSYRAIARIDLLAVLLVVAVLLAVLAPVLADPRVRGADLESIDNLRRLHVAQTCYAVDWEDRQFTAVPDDFGASGGSCPQYVRETGCYPPLILGWDCGPQRFYAFRVECEALGGGSCGANVYTTVPLNLGTGLRIGSYRLHNARPLHDYVDGRFYDRTFYVSADTFVYGDVEPFLDLDCEFVGDGDLLPSSYALSPAAMYHPEVLRARARGGYRDPGSFDEGFASPAVSQVAYPALKTKMLEHNWLRTAPAECHPGGFVDPLNEHREDCQPYLFNHGAAARPVTLYFDGAVGTLRTGDAAADDARVLEQTGGVDGLWSRDTPLGEDGYFGAFSAGGIRASHHILTTDGALGRDRLETGAGPTRALRPGATP